MLLYHGTSLKQGEKILKTGLRPRGKRVGNWQHVDVPSNPGCVYLTTVFAGYYAACVDTDGEGWAVFEIDANRLNPNHLLPDEDYLAQVSLLSLPPEDQLALGISTTPEAVRYYSRHLKNYSAKLNRPAGEQQLTSNGRLLSWQDSVRELGTCAHFGLIPLSAVTRVAVWRNPDVSPWFAQRCLNAGVHIRSYRYGGREYHGALTRAMFPFEDPAELEKTIETIAFDGLGGREQWLSLYRQPPYRNVDGEPITAALTEAEIEALAQARLQQRLEFAREIVESARFEVRHLNPPAESRGGEPTPPGPLAWAA